jgi:sucrose synthase
MIELIHSILGSEEKADFSQFLHRLQNQDSHYLLRNEILSIFADQSNNPSGTDLGLRSSLLSKLLNCTQEIILEGENSYFVVRPKIANQIVFRVTDALAVEPVSVQECSICAIV